MSEQTVFIKRFPAKGELPKKKGWYDTSQLPMYFTSNCEVEKQYYGKENLWLKGTEAMLASPAPAHFYEEVPLSSLLPEIVVPSRLDIADFSKSMYSGQYTEEGKGNFWIGANWAIKEVKRINPSLFPSTTKTDKT